MADASRPRLVVRPLRKSDIRGVQELHRRCFPTLEPWTKEQLDSQIAIFPEGQLGIEVDGKLVATSSTLVVDEEDFGGAHTFKEVSDSGFIRNHDPDGDTLYGIDIAVDPSYRGQHLARRLYEARKELARADEPPRDPDRRAGSRTTPRRPRRCRPRSTSAGWCARSSRTRCSPSQLAQGFAIRGVLKDYLPSDTRVDAATRCSWSGSTHAHQPARHARGPPRARRRGPVPDANDRELRRVRAAVRVLHRYRLGVPDGLPAVPRAVHEPAPGAGDRRASRAHRAQARRVHRALRRVLHANGDAATTSTSSAAAT